MGVYRIEPSPELEDKVKRILDSQLFAVLATSKDDEPHCCLVSFASLDGLKSLVFATMRNRLKYRNMAANPRVSLMIDDRKNAPDDVRRATTLTITGKADETQGDERRRCLKALLKRHRGLKEFVSSNDCAIMKVLVEKILIVSRFESVITIEL